MQRDQDRLNRLISDSQQRKGKEAPFASNRDLPDSVDKKPKVKKAKTVTPAKDFINQNKTIEAPETRRN